MAALDFDVLKQRVITVNGLQLTVGAIILIVIVILIWRNARS